MKKLSLLLVVSIFLTNSISNVFATETVPKWCQDYIYGNNETVLISPDGTDITYIGGKDRINWQTIRRSGITSTYEEIYSPAYTNNGKDLIYIAVKLNPSVEKQVIDENYVGEQFNDINGNPPKNEPVYKTIKTDPYITTVFVKNDIETVMTGSVFNNNGGYPMYSSNGKDILYILQDNKWKKTLYKNNLPLDVNLDKYFRIRDLILSPNGKSFAFVGYYEGVYGVYQEIFVKDGIEDTTYINYNHITFSPNGESISYTADEYESGKYWKHILVKDGVNICKDWLNCGLGIYYSPDGKSYAYIAEDIKSYDNTLYTSRLIKDGVDVSKWKYWGFMDIQFSPDSSEFVFYAYTKKSKDITTVSIKNGKEFWMGYFFNGPMNFHYSPDGKNTAFVGIKNDKITWEENVILNEKEIIKFPRKIEDNSQSIKSIYWIGFSEDSKKLFVNIFEDMSGGKYQKHLTICPVSSNDSNTLVAKTYSPQATSLSTQLVNIITSKAGGDAEKVKKLYKIVKKNLGIRATKEQNPKKKAIYEEIIELLGNK